MVDQQEFHHPFAGLLDHRRIGEHFGRLAIGAGPQILDAHGAGRGRLGRPALHLNQTHAAIAGHRQALMITEARNFGASGLSGLQQRVIVRNFDELAVDLDICHQPYSAAIDGTAPSLVDEYVYWSIRSSMTWRKLRIRPWIGQAAASPSAQMVWPSICLVTSNSMSISRFWAGPSTMRSMTRIIQPVPSRHGVHRPQLSCLKKAEMRQMALMISVDLSITI